MGNVNSFFFNVEVIVNEVFRFEDGVKVICKFIVFFFSLGINLVLIFGIRVIVEIRSRIIINISYLVCSNVKESVCW